MPPVTEPSKTECPECGNVWQEHTLNELEDCKSLLKLKFSVALMCDAKLQGKSVPTDHEVVLCPVCGKTSDEHTEPDVTSCAGKWRKREIGSTGLDPMTTFTEAHFEGEEPDPVKRAQLRVQMMQALCRCGKAYGDHTENEIVACAERNRGR